MAKKAKAEEPAKPNPAHLQIDGRFITEADRQRLKGKAATDAEALDTYNAISARAMSEPEVRAAAVIQEFQGDSLNINSLVDELRQQVSEVQAGSLKRPEAMLTAQAHTLDALFSNLARRSHGNSNAGYLDAAERYMRLALKAQAQAVRTIEALGELKNPRPVTFVRQANLATNQQVNNGMPSQAGETQKAAEQTISGGSYELLENTRASSIEGATYPPVATLEALNRAEVCRG
jgi:hypothetical protein